MLTTFLEFWRWPLRHPIAAFKFYVLRRRPTISPGEVGVQVLFTGHRTYSGAMTTGSVTLSEDMLRAAVGLTYDVTLPTKGPG